MTQKNRTWIVFANIFVINSFIWFISDTARLPKLSISCKRFKKNPSCFSRENIFCNYRYFTFNNVLRIHFEKKRWKGWIVKDHAYICCCCLFVCLFFWFVVYLLLLLNFFVCWVFFSLWNKQRHYHILNRIYLELIINLLYKLNQILKKIYGLKRMMQIWCYIGLSVAFSTTFFETLTIVYDFSQMIKTIPKWDLQT